MIDPFLVLRWNDSVGCYLDEYQRGWIHADRVASAPYAELWPIIAAEPGPFLIRIGVG